MCSITIPIYPIHPRTHARTHAPPTHHGSKERSSISTGLAVRSSSSLMLAALPCTVIVKIRQARRHCYELNRSLACLLVNTGGLQQQKAAPYPPCSTHTPPLPATTHSALQQAAALAASPAAPGAAPDRPPRALLPWQPAAPPCSVGW